MKQNNFFNFFLEGILVIIIYIIITLPIVSLVIQIDYLSMYSLGNIIMGYGGYVYKTYIYMPLLLSIPIIFILYGKFRNNILTRFFSVISYACIFAIPICLYYVIDHKLSFSITFIIAIVVASIVSGGMYYFIKNKNFDCFLNDRNIIKPMSLGVMIWLLLLGIMPSVAGLCSYPLFYIVLYKIIVYYRVSQKIKVPCFVYVCFFMLLFAPITFTLVMYGLMSIPVLPELFIMNNYYLLKSSVDIILGGIILCYLIRKISSDRIIILGLWCCLGSLVIAGIMGIMGTFFSALIYTGFILLGNNFLKKSQLTKSIETAKRCD